MRTNAVLLRIRDNGLGIPAQDLPRVFEKGFTGANGRKLGKSTGMGLYIVRCTLEKYDGNIHVTSDESRTIFSGFIPHGRKEHHEQKTTRAGPDIAARADRR